MGTCLVTANIRTMRDAHWSQGAEELQEWIDRGDRIVKASEYLLIISRYGKVVVEVK